MNSPLEDPRYVPEHPPINGIIPDVVARFGKNTQIRWFERFRGQLSVGQNLDEYYVRSEYHKGSCCFSCIAEFDEDSGVIMDGYCCCRDSRI